VNVDQSVDLEAKEELRLSDSSVSTSSFPMYDYVGFSCGKTLENRRIVKIETEGNGSAVGTASKEPEGIEAAGTYKWPAGTILELTAIAGEQHRFVEWRWTDGGPSTTSTVPITVLKDMTITAVFEKET